MLAAASVSSLLPKPGVRLRANMPGLFTRAAELILGRGPDRPAGGDVAVTEHELKRIDANTRLQYLFKIYFD